MDHGKSKIGAAVGVDSGWLCPCVNPEGTQRTKCGRTVTANARRSLVSLSKLYDFGLETTSLAIGVNSHLKRLLLVGAVHCKLGLGCSTPLESW